MFSIPSGVLNQSKGINSDRVKRYQLSIFSCFVDVSLVWRVYSLFNLLFAHFSSFYRISIKDKYFVTLHLFARHYQQFYPGMKLAYFSKKGKIGSFCKNVHSNWQQPKLYLIQDVEYSKSRNTYIEYLYCILTLINNKWYIYESVWL